MTMTPGEINKFIMKYIGVEGGNLNIFTHSTLNDFYSEYCELDIDVQKFRQEYESKAKIFKAILIESKPLDQAKIIRGTINKVSSEQSVEYSENRQKYEDEFIKIAEMLENSTVINSAELKISKKSVLEALKDAEVLLQQRGPTSAVDRVHTALHGYLKELCQDRNLDIGEDPSLPKLFKIIRSEFPEFKGEDKNHTEILDILNSMSQGIDKLNKIRNEGTRAHPQDGLIGEPEAWLCINFGFSILNYLSLKL